MGRREANHFAQSSPASKWQRQPLHPDYEQLHHSVSHTFTFLGKGALLLLVTRRVSWDVESHVVRAPKKSCSGLGELPSSTELPIDGGKGCPGCLLAPALPLALATTCGLFLQGWRQWRPALPCLTLATSIGMCLESVGCAETEPQAFTSTL